MIYQWVYGYSCWSRRKKPSDRPSRGFGTFSWTEGLSFDEIEELERRCGGYEFPYENNLPSRPTLDEVEQLFPVAFYSFTLSSGRKAIVRTRYIGDGFFDHRPGATIAHGLVLDSGDWPHYAIEYVDSPAFWRELPKDIRDEALLHKDDDRDNPQSPQPAYLPALDEKDLKVTGNYSCERVASHFPKDSLLGQKLVGLVNAFLSNNIASGRCCSIYAPDDEMVWMLAGLTMIFPKRLAGELSFATRLDNAMPIAEDSGKWYSVAGCKMRDAELNIDQLSDMADLRWLFDAIFRKRDQFDAFLQDFSSISLSDFPRLVRLFNFLSGTVGDSAQSESDDLISLVESHGNEDARKSLITRLASSPACLPDVVTPEWMGRICSLAKDFPALSSSCDALFISVRNRLVGNPFEAFSNRLHQDGQTLSRMWLERYSKSDVSTLGIVFTLLSLSAENRLEEIATRDWDALYVSGPSVDWKEVLRETLKRVPRAFPIVFLKTPDEDARNAILDENCRDVDATVGFLLRFVKAGARDRVREMMSRLIARSSDKDAFLRAAMDGFDRADASFADYLFAELAPKLSLPVMKDDNLGWYSRRAAKLPEAARVDFMKRIESRLAFPSRVDKGLISALKDFIRDASLPVNRPERRAELLLWYARVVAKAPDDPFAELQTLKATFASQTAAERILLIKGVMPLLLNRCSDQDRSKSEEQQKCLVDVMFAGLGEPYLSEAVELYIKALSSDLKQRRLGAASIRPGALVKCSLGGFSDAGLRGLFVEKLSKTVFKKYSEKDLNDLKNVLGPFSQTEDAAWTTLCESVKANGGFFSGLMKFFRRK